MTCPAGRGRANREFVRSSVAPEASRLAFVTVAVTLCLVYGLTLAPDVTFWDAGEFNAAIGTLGIPHPPGTPLCILIGNVMPGAGLATSAA